MLHVGVDGEGAATIGVDGGGAVVPGAVCDYIPYYAALIAFLNA